MRVHPNTRPNRDLARALKARDPAKLREALANGADPNAGLDAWMQMVLAHAVQLPNGKEMASILLDAGADPFLSIQAGTYKTKLRPAILSFFRTWPEKAEALLLAQPGSMERNLVLDMAEAAMMSGNRAMVEVIIGKHSLGWTDPDLAIRIGTAACRVADDPSHLVWLSDRTGGIDALSIQELSRQAQMHRCQAMAKWLLDQHGNALLGAEGEVGQDTDSVIRQFTDILMVAKSGDTFSQALDVFLQGRKEDSKSRQRVLNACWYEAIARGRTDAVEILGERCPLPDTLENPRGLAWKGGRDMEQIPLPPLFVNMMNLYHGYTRRMKMTRMLVNLGADPRACNEQGANALHALVHRSVYIGGRAEGVWRTMAKWLEAQGLDWEAPDNHGQSALMSFKKAVLSENRPRAREIYDELSARVAQEKLESVVGGGVISRRRARM